MVKLNLVFIAATLGFLIQNHSLFAKLPVDFLTDLDSYSTNFTLDATIFEYTTVQTDDITEFRKSPSKPTRTKASFDLLYAIRRGDYTILNNVQYDDLKNAILIPIEDAKIRINDHPVLRNYVEIKPFIFLEELTKGSTHQTVLRSILGGISNADPRVRILCAHIARIIGKEFPKLYEIISDHVKDGLLKETIKNRKIYDVIDFQGFDYSASPYMELNILYLFIYRAELVKKIDNLELPYDFFESTNEDAFKVLTSAIDGENETFIPSQNWSTYYHARLLLGGIKNKDLDIRRGCAILLSKIYVQSSGQSSKEIKSIILKAADRYDILRRILLSRLNYMILTMDILNDYVGVDEIRLAINGLESNNDYVYYESVRYLIYVYNLNGVSNEIKKLIKETASSAPLLAMRLAESQYLVRDVTGEAFEDYLNHMDFENLKINRTP